VRRVDLLADSEIISSTQLFFSSISRTRVTLGLPGLLNVIPPFRPLSRASGPPNISADKHRSVRLVSIFVRFPLHLGLCSRAAVVSATLFLFMTTRNPHSLPPRPALVCGHLNRSGFLQPNSSPLIGGDEGWSFPLHPPTPQTAPKDFCKSTVISTSHSAPYFHFSG